MSADLPSALRAALDRVAEGVSRSDAAARAASISSAYRSGGTSATIADARDALAYAFTRMPATYAAVSACLVAVRDAMPDFAPRSLLDVGAGPGTASWAAADAFPGLSQFSLVDRNPALRSLAVDLFADAGFTLDYRLSDISSLPEGASWDLVVVSYAIGEMTAPARQALIDSVWPRTQGVLLIVEPGTPDGYRRILEVRRLAVAAGATVSAPCPHDLTCPLREPDWCHFSKRLSRLRSHKQVKQVEVPFEDERFSYVALARAMPDPRRSRILAPTNLSKIAVKTKLCTRSGVGPKAFPRRDRAAYAMARRLDWGDAVDIAVPDEVTAPIPPGQDN